MSKHLVIRRGQGALHIAEPHPDGYHTLCGRTITDGSTKVHLFPAGKPATAIWGMWHRCDVCASEDKRKRRK